MAVTREAYIMGTVCFTLHQSTPDTRPYAASSKAMEMAMGNMGGMPNSTDRTSGAMKPTARPHGPPSTKPHSRMGKCIGHSMLPTCGTWPVIMGSTKASARNSAASTRLRVVEWGFVFIKSFLLWPDKKGVCPAYKPTADPFVVSIAAKIRWQNAKAPCGLCAAPLRKRSGG